MELRAALKDTSDLARCMLFAESADPRRSFFIFPAGAFLSSPPELFQLYFPKNFSTGLSFSLLS
jgi:hypothetical protein